MASNSQSAREFYTEWRRDQPDTYDGHGYVHPPRELLTWAAQFTEAYAAPLRAEVERLRQEVVYDKNGVTLLNPPITEADSISALKARVSALEKALTESVKLQSHYAKLLNMWDGGERLEFKDAGEWLARLELLASRAPEEEKPSLS